MLPPLHAAALDQRRAFIAAYNRYELLVDAGLHDLPRAPRSNPRATDPAIAAMIVKAKQALRPVPWAYRRRWRSLPSIPPSVIVTPTLRDRHSFAHRHSCVDRNPFGAIAP